MTSTYDRRQFLTHSAAAAGGVVAAGALVDELATTEAAGAATKPRIKNGGTLRMGLISEQNTKVFNPDYGNMDTSGFCYARAVYDPLMVVSENGKTVLPYLAESLTHNAAYDEWTITARPGVKFHDGTPCNGDAIYANLHADYISLLTGRAVQALIKGFTHVPGSNTVTVLTKYKWTTFPYTLAEQQIAFIAKPTTLAPDYTGLPIGTGPFVASAWDFGNSFTCVKNTEYWRAGLPYLDGIVFSPIPDGPTRLMALQSGAQDIIHEADGKDLQAFKSLGSSYNYVIDFPGNPVYSPSCNCVMMNLKKSPFTDKNFRLACAYALNPATFVSFVDDGLSVPINGIYLKGSPYYKNPSYPKYNPTQAKAYLKKAKTPHAFTLTYVSGSPAVLEFATLVYQQMKAIGITVTLVSTSQGKLIGDAIAGTYQALTWAQFGTVSPRPQLPLVLDQVATSTSPTTSTPRSRRSC